MVSILLYGASKLWREKVLVNERVKGRVVTRAAKIHRVTGPQGAVFLLE